MTKTILKHLCGCLMLLFYSCSQPESQIQPLSEKAYCLDESFKSKIELERPILQPVTEIIPLTGAVEPNPDKVIHFVSLVDGVVANTGFSLGDEVRQGQVLAELRSTELSDLQSQSRTLASQIKVAENDLQSIQSMFEDGIASKKNLLEAESRLEIVKAEFDKIEANLQLFSASPENEVFQIKSPSAGIITSKNIAAGMQISAGNEALFTISDLSEVWVVVNVYASNVTNIETGMKVHIRTLSYPDEVFEGEIAAISQVLDAEARVLKARVVLENKDLKLKPGMIVDVNALKEIQGEALSLPTSTMVFDHGRNYVVVYQDDCQLEIRPLDIITQNNGTTFISGGLSGDEDIISKNQLLIYEQVKSF